MSRELLAVIGLGRCGTSLALQLLYHGGAPVFVGGEGCEYPSFEDNRMVLNNTSRAAVMREAVSSGAIIKWLAPAINPIPWGECERARVVLLRRDVHQQADSQIKFGVAAGATLMSEYPRALKILKRSLNKEYRALATSLARNKKARVLKLSFEDLISAPSSAALQMASFLLDDPGGFDAIAAAKSYIPRTSDNYPGLLENALIEEMK